MRNIMLFLLLCIGFSCGGEENQSGYNCESGQCTATFENPTYLTLQDCESTCGSSAVVPPIEKPGSIYFVVSFSAVCRTFAGGFTLNTVNLGYGYSSTDVVNDAFIASWKFQQSDSKTVNNVKPGIYYYKATRSSTDSNCSTVVKSGSFTIESSKSTRVDIYL